MRLDDLLQRYFATTDLSGVAPDTFAAGIEHCRVDLGLEALVYSSIASCDARKTSQLAVPRWPSVRLTVRRAAW